MVFAKNDIGFVFGNTRFLKCKVSLRKNATWPLNCKNTVLSKLINPSYAVSKGQVVCFCDGIKETEILNEIVVVIPDAFDDEPVILPGDECIDGHESIELENEFKNKTALTISDIHEERENKYNAEKIVWVHHNSNSVRLVAGIDHGYDCDEAYLKERLEKELAGFFIVDHTTLFWKASYPSEVALSLEDEFKLQLNGSRSKYGTQIKVCLLEEHNNIKYNDVEAIVIINYLGKFDIIGIVDTVGLIIYEQQQQRECSRSEVFSN